MISPFFHIFPVTIHIFPSVYNPLPFLIYNPLPFLMSCHALRPRCCSEPASRLTGGEASLRAEKSAAVAIQPTTKSWNLPRNPAKNWGFHHQMVVQQSWNGDYSHLVGGLEPWNFMTFHSVRNNHPNWLYIFQRGWNHQPEDVRWNIWIYLRVVKNGWTIPPQMAIYHDLPIIFQQVTFLICGRVVTQWVYNGRDGISTMCVTGFPMKQI